MKFWLCLLLSCCAPVEGRGQGKKMIDTNISVDARFFHRWLTVSQLKEILDGLKDDDKLLPNRVGNLSVVRESGEQVGYIDFQAERFEAFE